MHFCWLVGGIGWWIDRRTDKSIGHHRLGFDHHTHIGFGHHLALNPTLIPTSSYTQQGLASAMGRAFDVTPMEIEGREALMLDVPESVRCVGWCFDSMVCETDRSIRIRISYIRLDRCV